MRTELCSLGDRGQCVDGLAGGGAAISGSCSQFLSQLSDFFQQLSLAGVQVGPASVQGDWRKGKKSYWKIIYIETQELHKLVKLIV